MTQKIIKLLVLLTILALASWFGVKTYRQQQAVKAEQARLAAEAARRLAIELNLSESGQLTEITSGQFTRTFSFHLPPDFDRQTPISVLLAFHGAGDTAQGMETYSGLSGLADTHGFLAVYPNGYKNSWADGRGMAAGDRVGVDDVQFVRDMINYLSAKYPIDQSKIFATGFSAGGYFVYKLACEPDGLIKGIAPVGAGFPATLDKTCQPGYPASLLLVLGNQDPSYFGAYTQSGVFINSGAKTLTKWSELIGCPGGPIEDKGEFITITGYTGCREGNETNYVVLKGVGHDWIAGQDDYFDTGRLVVSFFGLEKN